ncbi:2-oxoglutarate and iron-dependent oxygenase domain-containing protein [Pseudomonas sp. N040]|uniref:2-oxoglutarate and iron-dependent oxygenase domain-containing protein n=1 Tax=Pseudomonas sp. N040 TaxID=2785325 RepID=UPI0018A2F53B|nr:2-oxoglutarate and iron-dependent oxygenase domain-containing protein [Pseudomonas sp. N040]MBF7729330.1 hypothetical protein [Pseudomonas sp. N040]MBW7012970.1 hypothetical protein [Pseudomonas sp. N040]
MKSELDHSPAHSAFKPLPPVNISSLDSTVQCARKTAAQALGAEAADAGFLFVVGHGTAPELIDTLKAATRAYFFRSPEQKMRDAYLGG